MLGSLGVLLEVELLDRVRLAVGIPAEEPRHGQAEVPRVVRLAQRPPRRVLRRREDLGEVARIGQLLPALHLHDGGRDPRDERAVGRRRHLRHLPGKLRVRRRVIEEVVANEAAEGLAAELPVLGLVDLLEDRALVPGHALVALQRPPEVRLGDVEHPDLQHLVGLGTRHQVIEPTPGALDFLEGLVVHDQVDLLAELPIERRDHRLDRSDGVRRDQRGLRQRLLRERAHGRLHRFLRGVGSRLEFLVEK